MKQIIPRRSVMVREVFFLNEDDGLEGELPLKTFVNKDLADFYLTVVSRRYPQKKFYMSSRPVTLGTPDPIEIETLFT